MAEIDFAISAGGGFNDLIADLQYITGEGLRTVSRQVIPAAERLLDRLIDAHLRKYPPKRNRSDPFVFSDDPVKNRKAQIWFAINYPNGYRRTGRLGRAWEGEILLSVNGGAVTLTVDVRNETAYASRVYGAEQFGYKQVPGHAHTGWKNSGRAVPPIVLETAVFLEESGYAALEALFDKRIGT